MPTPGLAVEEIAREWIAHEVCPHDQSLPGDCPRCVAALIEKSLAARDEEIARARDCAQESAQIMRRARDRAEAAERDAERLRAALVELVAVKDLKDRSGANAEYLARQPKAWAEARAALSGGEKA